MGASGTAKREERETMYRVCVGVLLGLLASVSVVAQAVEIVSRRSVTVVAGQSVSFSCRAGVVDWTLFRGVADYVVLVGFHPPHGFGCMGPFESSEGDCIDRVDVDPVRRSPLTIRSVRVEDAGVLQCTRRTTSGQYQAMLWNVTVVSGDPPSLTSEIDGIAYKSGSTDAIPVTEESEISFTCATPFAGYDPGLQLLLTDGVHSAAANKSKLLQTSSHARDAVFSSSAMSRVSATYTVKPSDDEFSVSCHVKGVMTPTAPFQLFHRTDDVPIAAPESDLETTRSSNQAPAVVVPGRLSKGKQLTWPRDKWLRPPASTDPAATATDSAARTPSTAGTGSPATDSDARPPSTAGRGLSATDSPTTVSAAQTDSTTTTERPPLTADLVSTDPTAAASRTDLTPASERIPPTTAAPSTAAAVLMDPSTSVPNTLEASSLSYNLTLSSISQEAGRSPYSGLSVTEAFGLAVWIVLGSMLILAVTTIVLILLRRRSQRPPLSPQRMPPGCQPVDNWPFPGSSTHLLYNYNDEYPTKGQSMANSEFTKGNAAKMQFLRPNQRSSSRQQLPPISPGELMCAKIPEFVYDDSNGSPPTPCGDVIFDNMQIRK